MFKLCQKPFAERKPIIQHPRPGRCLLQIQVPLILTQLGLIDSQPIPTWSF
ncbi:unnamed protein product [Brassica oleracea]